MAAKGLPSDGQTTSMVRSSAAGHALAADDVEVERLRAGRPFVARVHGGSSWRVGFLYTGRPARAARDQARSRARSHAVAGRSNRR